MAMIIKPDETTAAKKRVHFAIYDINGLITDHEAFGLGLAWAVDTFAPAAGDLKVGIDNAASVNYGGTFAYRKNGEWYYEFSNAEVAASLGADTVYFEFYKTGYRTIVLRIPLRYDVESIKTGTIVAATFAAGAIDAAAIAADAIDADAIKADAITEIQAGLSTSLALTSVAGDVTLIKAKTDNLPGDPADASDIAALFAAAAATDALIKAKTDNLPSDPADASDVAAAFGTVNTTLATIAGYIDTEVGSIYTVVTNIGSNLSTANLRLAKVLGLLHLNSVIDEHTFDDNDLLVSARLRVFADATIAESAITDEPDDAHGETHRFAITAIENDDDDGLPKRYQLIEEVVAGS